MAKKRTETVANNPTFGEKWEQLQKDLGQVLKAAHTDSPDDVAYNKAINKTMDTLVDLGSMVGIKKAKE